MTHLWMLLAMGFAGSLHCAGMCGGLALVARRLPLFLLGKSSTYLLLGALAGAVGNTVVRLAPFGWGVRVLAVTTAVFLLVMALDSLGVVRVPQTGPGGLARGLAGLASAGPAGSLLMGSATGLLPCPMVYAFLAVAAGTGSVVEGTGTLLVLAVTSALPLALCVLLGRRFTLRLPLVSGVLMVAMAALTLYRGLAPRCPFH